VSIAIAGLALEQVVEHTIDVSEIRSARRRGQKTRAAGLEAGDPVEIRADDLGVWASELGSERDPALGLGFILELESEEVGSGQSDLMLELADLSESGGVGFFELDRDRSDVAECLRRAAATRWISRRAQFMTSAVKAACLRRSAVSLGDAEVPAELPALLASGVAQPRVTHSLPSSA
jgi:hypothetical protein